MNESNTSEKVTQNDFFQAKSIMPSLAVLEMSYACNRRCVFCSCPWYAPRSKYSTGAAMEKEEYFEILDHYIDDCGVGTIAFSGGEPLLFDGLRELIDRAAEKKVEKTITGNDGNVTVTREPVVISLNTNGDLLDAGWLDYLKDRSVRLSVAFPGLKTFALLSGIPGAGPEKTLALFGEMSKRGLNAAANITVSRANFAEIYDVMAEALLAGASSLYLNRFLPGGRGLGFVKELTLDAAMISDFIAMAADVLETSKRQGNFGAAIPVCVSGGKKYEYLRIASRCSAGRDIFVTDPAGLIRPCSHTPKNFGRWRDHEKILAGPYWTALRRQEYLPESCFGCKSRFDCDGGCPEAAHIIGGSIRSVDPVFSLFGKTQKKIMD